MADTATAQDQFEIAGRLIKSASMVGRRLKDQQVTRDLLTRSHDLDKLKTKFVSIRKALDTLAENPADGDANAVAGQWYCLVKGDWEKGLPLLAAGNNAELAKLAKRDLAQPAAPKQQVEVAEGWRALAEKEPPPAKSVVQARAAYWYNLALPKLTGLDKAGVEERLKAMTADAAATTRERRGKDPKNAGVPRPEIDIVFEKQGVVDRSGHTKPAVAGQLRSVAGPAGTVAAHFQSAMVDLGHCDVGTSPFTLEIVLRPDRSGSGFQQFAGWHRGGVNGALFLGREGERLHINYPTDSGRIQETKPLVRGTGAMAPPGAREGTGGGAHLCGRPAGPRLETRGRGFSHPGISPHDWQRERPRRGLLGRRVAAAPLSQCPDGTADSSPGRKLSGPQEMTTLHKTFVIAEMACSHEGDPALARTIIDAAGTAGADAIQFQIWRVADIMVPHHPDYRKNSRLQFSDQGWDELAAYVHRRYPDMQIIGCVQNRDIVELCESFPVAAYKLHSSDLSNPEIVTRVAETGRRIDLCVGASTLDEIETAIEWIRAASDAEIWLMYGLQLFPTQIDAAHLRYMKQLGRLFQLPVGYQDHCEGGSEAGFWLPAAAVGMGIRIVEKHITHDRSKKGIDHEAALNPDEFARFMTMVRQIDTAMGSARPRPFSKEELAYRKYCKKSLVASCGIAAGTVIAAEHLLPRRTPTLGLPPDQAGRLLGRTAKRPLARNELILEEDVA